MVLLWFFKLICLLDSYFIIKGCNSGRASWERGTGQGGGKDLGLTCPLQVPHSPLSTCSTTRKFSEPCPLAFHCLSGMTHTQLPIADTVLRGLSPSTIINKAAGNTSVIVLFGCSVMSNSLRPQLQHVGLPCPSLSPRVCLNSRPLSQ